MRAQCQFVIPFVAMLLIAMLLSIPFFNPAQATNQDLKKAGSVQGVNDIFHAWGESGKETARRNLALDWFFIAAYGATWIAAGRRFRPDLVWTKIAVSTGIAGAVADVVENICLWMLLHDRVTDKIAQTCKWVSLINVTLFLLTALYFMAVAIATACGQQYGGRRDQ